MTGRGWHRRGGILALLLLGGSVVPRPGWAARTVLVTGEPVLIRLQALQPTALTFPEPIAAVPTGTDPKQLSLELDGPHLFLQPLEPKVQGVLFALGVSGRNYPIRFVVGTPADTEVVLVLPASGSGVSPAGASAPPPPAPGLTVRTVLAALLKETLPPGATAADDHQVLLATDRLQLVTTRVVLAGPYVGYIAEAVNHTDQALPLLLPEYYAPGLKALTALADVLPPKGRTRVVLVFQPGSPH